MKKTTTNNNGITAIYVRRSVSDKDKGNNSLVDASVWLAVQDKKAHNKRIPNNANANHS